VAAGSGSAPEGLMPRRESLWLGEGWMITKFSTPSPLSPPAKGEEGFVKIYILKEST